MDPNLPPRPDFLPPGFGTVGHQDFVEIVAPAPVSYWPETWGWWVLLSIVVVGLFVATWRALATYRRNAYRRAALAELRQLRQRAKGDRDAALVALPGLVKRCALSAYPRDQVAALSGDAWLSFLNERAPGAFSQAAQDALTRLVFRSPDEVPTSSDQPLFEGAERWLRRHRA